MLHKKLGDRIAHLRIARGLTQVQLARAIGSSVDFVSHLERGVNAPSVDWLEGLASALEVRIADLFDFPDDRPKRARRSATKRASSPHKG